MKSIVIGERDVADQVGHEQHRALEDAEDDHVRLVGVVGGDLRPELGDARGDFFGRDQLGKRPAGLRGAVPDHAPSIPNQAGDRAGIRLQ